MIALENRVLWQGLEWGGNRIGEFFSQYMYDDYELWKKLAESEEYSPISHAFKEVDLALTEIIARAITEKGIGHIYSMGPSPDVDAALLEKVASAGVKATYHPVDINPEAASNARDYVRNHLLEKGLLDFISIDCTSGQFAELKSDGPSCVVYSGGTISNNRDYWEQAARLAKSGGIVAATTAVSWDHDDKEYWLHFYDNPQARQLLANAARKMLP